MAELTVMRKGYTRKDGTRVKASTFKIKDRGQPGRTPKGEQWYEPGVETGWRKDMPTMRRRRLVLRAHKGDELASARSMQALSNVTTDRETKMRAGDDASYFFKAHRAEMKRGSIRSSKTLRITPKRPRLRR